MIISFRFKWLAAAAFVFLGFLAFVPSTLAATRTWDGGGSTNNWSECANWDGPDACPTTADIATFSGTSTKAATIDASFTTGVTTFNMNSGYTGIITQARSFAVSGTATIASGTFNGSTDTFSTAAITVSGGTFTGGNQTVSHTGTFTLSSGTYTASSGTTTFSGAFTHTAGGTFSHNNGSVVFTGAATTTNVTTTESFYNLEINKNNAAQMTISSSDTLIVNNTLTLTNGGILTGSLNAKNTISLNTGWDGGGGTGTLLIDGTNTQNLALNGGQAALASTVTINNANFTLSGAGTGVLNFNILNLQAGAITATGYDVAVAGVFTQSGGTFTGGAGAITHTGAWTLSGGTYTATSGLTTFTAGFTHTSGGTFTHNNGAVSFTGTTATANVAVTESFYDLTVAKNTGVMLTVSSSDTLIVSHTLTLTDGAFATGTIESSGTLSYGAGWDGFTTASSGTLLLSGTGVTTLSLTGGQSALASTITMNNANLTVNGTGTGLLNLNIFNLQNGTFDSTGYDTTFASTFTQSGGTFTGGAGAIAHTGTFTLSAGMYTATSGTTTFGTFIHTAGGTFTPNNGTANFIGASNTIQVAVTETFYNLIIAKTDASAWTISTGYTIIVTNNATLTDGSIKTGILNVKGTISVASTWDGYTASTTGLILIDGTNTSSLSLNSGQSAIALTVTLNNANFTINGAGANGTLNFRALNLQAGTIDVTGYDTAVAAAYNQSGGTFTNAAGAVVFSSTFTLSNGTFTGGSGLITHTGTLTISGGTYSASSGTTNVSAAFTHTAGGIFTHNNGLMVANSGAVTWDVALTETVYDMTINTAGTNTLVVGTGDTFVVTHLLTLTNGQFSTGTLSVLGDMIENGTWDGGTSGSEIRIEGTGAQAVTLNDGGTEPANTFTINNADATVTLPATGTFLFFIFDLQAGTLTGQGSTVTFPTTCTQSGGTVNAGTGSLVYSGGCAQSGGTFNGQSAAVTYSGGFTLSAGTYNASSGTTSFGGFTHTAGGTFSAPAGLTRFTGNGATIDVNVSETFYNMEIAKTAAAILTLSASDTLTIVGYLTLTDGSLTGTTGLLSAQGNVTVASTWDGGSTPLAFSGSGTQTFDLTGATGLINSDISVNKTGGKVTLLSALVEDAASQDLTITQGTFALGGFDLTVNGSSGAVVVANTGVFELQGGEVITLNASNPTFQAGSLMKYVGTSGPYTLKDYAYQSVEIAGGVATVFSLPGTLSLAQNLTITSGVLSLEGNGLTVTGTFSNLGTLQLHGSETVTLTNDNNSGVIQYVGDSDGLADGYTLKDWVYYGLNVSLFDALDSVTATASPLDVNGDFSVTGGTFVAPASMTLGGDLLHSGGTFTHNSGTVTLDGASQTLTGTTTFNNFTKSVSAAAILTLPASTTQTFVGTLTLNGADGQVLSLRSSIADTQASIDPQGTRTVSYLNVKDSNNINATAVSCTTGCVNANGNTNWSFVSADVTVTESSGTTLATEGGATDSFTVVLIGAPTANVVITVSGDAQVSVSPSPLTFTTVNWATPQTVTVTAVNDALVEGAHSGTVSFSVASDDTGYNGLVILSISTAVTDNDTAGFTVSAISGNTTEAGGTATATIVLTAQPTADVIVGLSSSDTTEGTVSPASFTFTALNWSTPQTVTATGVNDDLDDGDILYGISTAAATSADNNFNTLNPANIAVTNTDNDASGFTVSAISGDTTEAGGTATATIVLTAQPTADVIVGLSSSDTTEGTVSPASFTFTSANWATPQTVTATGVNDFLVDGTVAYSIVTAAAVSDDVVYSGINPADVSVSNTDNDTAGFTVSVISGNTTEAGVTATATIVLTAQPSADVIVGLSSSDTGEGTVSPASFTFTSANWATPQTITATGVNDDLDDGDVAYSIITAAATSVDANYDTVNPADVSVTNTDNDTSGFTVSVISGDTTEAGGTATATIVFTAQPTADVIVGLTSSDTTEGTVSPASFTFTSANWATPQTVTVTGVNDFLVDGTVAYSIVTAAAVSDDVVYSGINPADVSVSNTDNDTASFTVSAISGNTTEAGGTATATIVLTSQPTADVVVGLTSSDTTEGTISPASFTFTSANWATPQTVTVTGVNDDLDDGDVAYSIVTAAATSVDTNYDAINPADVSATNTDNDVSGFTVSVISGNTTEAGVTATATIVLTAQPTADVIIGLSSSDTTEGTVSASSLTFTSANWSTPQTVTATGVNDDLDDGDVAYSIVTAAATSVDANYDTVNPADVSVTNTDNDASGFTVSAISGNTTEAGGTATATIVLTAQPTADVIVGLSSSDTTEGTVSPASFTFTSANWATPQTITATGVNDDLDDGDIAYSIITAAATSVDTNYNTVNPADVSVTNTDNDASGFTVSAISGNTTEAGGTATATIVLTAQPSADVIVGLSSSDTTEGTVSPASFTFTSANWATPQTVTATGVNDDLDDGDIAYSIITAAAVSDDVVYSGINPADVSVSNTDNDASGFTVSVISGDTTEAGGTATATIVLTAQPSADVIVGLSSSDTTEGTVSPASFTFTSANWATPQTITVTGVNDFLIDGTIAYSIVTAVAVSDDVIYNAINPADVAVNNTDNDTAGFTVSAISGNTTEAGGTATFTVVLTSQPTANVSVGISSSDTTEGTVSASSLTFTAGNWSTPQTITVTGVNDDLDDGDIAFSITTAAATSVDTNYDTLNPADVSATNTDNDVSGFTVSVISGNTTEAGVTATATVVLTAQPTADVIVGISSSDTTEGTVSPASLTFTSANWATPQTLTVTGVNDFVDDGDIVFSITTAAATSDDTNYNAVNPADVSVTNTDNDTAGATASAISGDTSEDEETTATFTIVLTAEPTADVIIPLTSSDLTEGTISPVSLTFTALNWTTPQTVTMTGVNDYLDDGNVTYSAVLGAITSVDVAYSGLNPSDVTVVNDDDDTSGFSVGAISGNTSEAGATATFTVVLNAQPTASVTVGISSSDASEGTTSPVSLTFTTGNWNTPKTVTVTGVDDVIDDGTVVYSVVTAAATSADGNYNGLNPSNVSVSTTDDDTAGITVGAISGNTSEAGGTATFTVVLNTEPVADVVIGITSNDTTEGTVSPSSLTFTSLNWSDPQTVTVTGANDDLDDGTIAYTIVTAAATSDDAPYNSLNAADVSVSNTDDDVSGFTVSAISGNTSEVGGTATATIVLTAQPTANVVIGLASNDTSEGTVSPSSFTFTSLNWSTPQTVTVTGADDDLDDGDIAYSIITAAATSADANYNTLNPADLALANTDDDISGITVSVISGDTSEVGGTATFTVVLNAQPAASVSIDLSSNDTGEGAVSPASLTFTTGNWNTPQTVTVTGADDGITDGTMAYSIVTAAAVSDDVNYNGINPADVNVSNIDNDVVGISVSAASGNTTEAGVTATLTVVLTSMPTADVVLGVSSSDTTEGTIAPSSLTFTSLNWDVPQTITVTGVDDNVDDGDVAYAVLFDAAVSDDLNYNGQTPDGAAVTNVDDDTAGITVGAISGDTTEAGGTATFTVVLNTEPTANVTVAVSSSDVGEAIVSTSSLTFTSLDWLTPQTITVTGVDDWLIDGSVAVNVVLAAAVSEDLGYNAVNPSDVSATNTDNDTAGVTISESDATTVVTEAGATDSYTFVLTAEPTSDVTVALTVPARLLTDVVSVVFTSLNWNVPQTITVSSDTDAIASGDEDLLITHGVTSDDVLFAAAEVADVSVHRVDNDATGITVGAISSATSETGTTATFTVVLTSEPTADVLINLSSSNLGEGTTSPASLTFTSLNWDDAQTVTVTGVNDDLIDGTVLFSIVLEPAVSDDLFYSGLDPSDVSLSNTDDDSAAVLVTMSEGSTQVSEAGVTDSYTLVLTAQPTASVTVSITPVGMITTDLSEVVFTVDTWSTPQTVTVLEVDDFIQQGTHFHTITHVSTSDDVVFSGLVISDVNVTVTDNDVAGFNLGAISGATSETGGTASFTMVLATQPTADVVITLSSSDTTEGTVSPAILTFTADNWSTPQTVTVTGVNDSVADGTIAYTIVTSAAESVDSFYNAINSSDVSVNNTDDDVVGITVVQSSDITTVTEGGDSDAYTLVLTSQPTSNVNIFMIGDADITTAVSQVTFTADTWNVPQAVVVSAVNDSTVETEEVHSILHVVTSADSLYAAVVVSGVAVTVTDNDTFEDDGNSGGGGGGSNTQPVKTGPSISVKMPANGATYALGSLRVSWASTGTIPAVNVYVSYDDGDTWALQRYFVTNSGSTTVNLEQESSAARVRVDGTNFISVLASDDSGAFSISPTAPADANEAGTLTEEEQQAIEEQAIAAVAARVASLPASFAIHELVKTASDNNDDTQRDSTIYYIGADGYRHAFPNSHVFSSWFCPETAVVQVVSASDLATAPLGPNVAYRPGNKMVKFITDPRVYVVDSDGSLRWVMSEDDATTLYGADWSKEIYDIADTFYRNYTFGTVLTDLSWDREEVRRSVLYPSDVMSVPGHLPDVDPNASLCPAGEPVAP